MTASVAERRVKKELQKLRKDPLDGMTVEVGTAPTEWFVTIIGEIKRERRRERVSGHLCFALVASGSRSFSFENKQVVWMQMRCGLFLRERVVMCSCGVC